MEKIPLKNYLKTILPKENEKKFFTLKNQAEISHIFDILNRKENHHAALLGASSEMYHTALIETIAYHLTELSATKTLREACFFYLDLEKLSLSAATPAEIEKDFKAFFKTATVEKPIILAINRFELLFSEESQSSTSHISKMIKSIFSDEKWRIIGLTQKTTLNMRAQEDYLASLFSIIQLNEPTEADSLAILKTYQDNLESFHQITIPDEMFASAFFMANHYLGNKHTALAQTLQLLDSAAARVSLTECHDGAEQPKPVLTNTVLLQVLSSWTKIPLSHFQQNKFKMADFIQGIQKQIFSQEAAVNLIGLVLQSARLKLQHKPAPLCSFLFVGPAHVGKTETAYAIAQQLFGSKEALLHVDLDKSQASLSNMKILSQTAENYHTSLLKAVQQRPYAVVLLENIHQAHPETIEHLQEILMSGFAEDKKGHIVDFRQAIIVMTTSLGADRIISLTQPHQAQGSQHTLDLLQLVLNNESVHEITSHHTNLSPETLCTEIMPELETHFSKKLLRHLNMIPFTLMDYPGIEKIMRLKIQVLTRTLETQFGVELGYVPEVLRFLVQETLWQNANTPSIDQTLEQHLYACVAHALSAHLENKNRPKHLLLQLNESGQMLRCGFISQDEKVSY